MADLVVAICTNRPPAAVAECLAALRPQLQDCEVVVAVNGSRDLYQEHRAAAGRMGFPVTVLQVATTGLSHARNAVLARYSDERLVAFIDDDAIVGVEWAECLQAAWAQAPAAVACIGGRIAPRFAGPRPAWLSDSLLPALTVLDYGPELQDLDPAVRTVYGANMSFRCGLLRSVGGFDPQFGHSGGRLWFSEEDEAQRALVAAGYKVRYVPKVLVEHVIPADRMQRGSFLRRRFQYGATLGVRGARGRWCALRQCVRSAAGLPGALLGGDAARLMERATRVVENAGVLVAPLLKR